MGTPQCGLYTVTLVLALLRQHDAHLPPAAKLRPAGGRVVAVAENANRLFEHAVAAQRIAFDAIRPGVTCADVDGAVLSYFERNDLLPYWRQHTGHAIGLRNHEAPFLDVGDNTTLEPGMVFTIEPGLYDSEIGGFRHSDTVVVTESSVDVLTAYPSDIESLTLPI